MSRATPVQNSRTSDKVRRNTAFVIVAALVAVVFLGYLSMASLFPPEIKIQPENGSKDVTLDQELQVFTSWMRGEVKNVSVREITLDPLGATVSDTIIEGSLNGDVFTRADGTPLLRPDSRYEVKVDAELTELTMTGPRKKEVGESASFQTITTPAPVFFQGTQTVPIGEPIIIEFNTPVETFSYELSPELPSTSRLDDENRTKAFITFEGYEQGKEYSLTVTSATADNGATMLKPYTQKITTTNPLKIFFTPGDGESGVSLSTRPTLTFSEDIKNPEIVESILSFDPQVLGGWDWVAPDQIEFKPLADWTQGQKVTIRLKGGTEAFRGVSGSYLRQDVESSFTAKPSKQIDVNLTEQKVYLYDNDKLVRTMICSSGSQATPSLTGTYSVYAKAEKLDMRGEGYVAPNVPWVLMFNGDYTIHGNYWSTTFGTPTSHGCVGLPLDEAEYLFNWTPMGTIVSIHY